MFGADLTARLERANQMILKDEEGKPNTRFEPHQTFCQPIKVIRFCAEFKTVSTRSSCETWIQYHPCSLLRHGFPLNAYWKPVFKDTTQSFAAKYTSWQSFNPTSTTWKDRSKISFKKFFKAVYHNVWCLVQLSKKFEICFSLNLEEWSTGLIPKTRADPLLYIFFYSY